MIAEQYANEQRRRAILDLLAQQGAAASPAGAIELGRQVRNMAHELVWQDPAERDSVIRRSLALSEAAGRALAPEARPVPDRGPEASVWDKAAAYLLTGSAYNAAGVGGAAVAGFREGNLEGERALVAGASAAGAAVLGAGAAAGSALAAGAGEVAEGAKRLVREASGLAGEAAGSAVAGVGDAAGVPTWVVVAGGVTALVVVLVVVAVIVK